MMWIDVIRRIVIAEASLVVGLTLYIFVAAFRYRAPFRRRPIYPLCGTLGLAILALTFTVGDRVGDPHLNWRTPATAVIATLALATLLGTAWERRQHHRHSTRAAQELIDAHSRKET